MAGKAWSFGKAAEVAGFARSALRRRDEHIVIHVLVDEDCPRWLGNALKELLVSELSTSEVLVWDIGDALPVRDGADAALFLVSSLSSLDGAFSYASHGVPVALVAEDALDVPEAAFDESAPTGIALVCAGSPEALSDELGSWLAGSCAAKQLALAANFPFCRNAVVDALINRCALENVTVGALWFMPGSDLPVMTLNQMRLAVDISAAYGRGVEASRLAELAVVAAGGFTWRRVARALLGSLPGLGLPLRAGIAYLGTRAAGEAMRLRFETELAAPSHTGRGKPERRTESVLPVASEDDGYVTIGGTAA